VATFTFAEGSVATLTYTALGHKDVPKETAELYVDGKVAMLHDYKALVVHGADQLSVKTHVQDKGLMAELKRFAAAIQQGGDWPIPWWQQLQVNEMAFAVEDLIYAA